MCLRDSKQQIIIENTNHIITLKENNSRKQDPQCFCPLFSIGPGGLRTRALDPVIYSDLAWLENYTIYRKVFFRQKFMFKLINLSLNDKFLLFLADRRATAGILWTWSKLELRVEQNDRPK